MGLTEHTPHYCGFAFRDHATEPNSPGERWCSHPLKGAHQFLEAPVAMCAREWRGLVSFVCGWWATQPAHLTCPPTDLPVSPVHTPSHRTTSLAHPVLPKINHDASTCNTHLESVASSGGGVAAAICCRSDGRQRRAEARCASESLITTPGVTSAALIGRPRLDEGRRSTGV